MIARAEFFRTAGQHLPIPLARPEPAAAAGEDLLPWADPYIAQLQAEHNAALARIARHGLTTAFSEDRLRPRSALLVAS